MVTYLIQKYLFFQAKELFDFSDMYFKRHVMINQKHTGAVMNTIVT